MAIYSGFSHENMWFSTAMLNYQRVVRWSTGFTHKTWWIPIFKLLVIMKGYLGRGKDSTVNCYGKRVGMNLHEVIHVMMSLQARHLSSLPLPLCICEAIMNRKFAVFTSLSFYIRVGWSFWHLMKPSNGESQGTSNCLDEMFGTAGCLPSSFLKVESRDSSLNTGDVDDVL